MRLLLVEDSKIDAQAITRQLEKSKIDFEIIHQPDPQKAKEFLQNDHEIDFLLTDNNLPGEQGIDLCRDILKIYGQQFPMVLLTGNGNEKIAVEALKSGINDYIIKDISGNYLKLLPFVIKQHRESFQDRAERRKAESALAKVAEELAEKNQDLNRFAQMVAHDLKGPITTLIGFSELLEVKLDETDPEEMAWFMDKITSLGRKADTIIDNLLLLSVVSEGEVTTTPVEMGPIITDAISRLLPNYEHKKPQIIQPDNWPICLGHAGWIEEIWANLICNGLKYGGAPPILEIGHRTISDSMTRYWIKDNGPGIPGEMKNAIFEPFKRLRSDSGEHGTGLGLSIVQRITEKLNGQVGVDSQPNEGSTFYFDLPSI